jgi:hypothetical protein
VNSATVFAAAFAALYAGHMVGDHIVQTDWQAANKAGKGRTARRAMIGHLAGYYYCQAIALAAVYLATGAPIAGWTGFVGLVFSVASHGLIDRRWPVRWLLEHTGSGPFSRLASGGINGMYLGDQALHIGCLFISALIIGGLS